jgi:serine/threonine-protein kinase
MADLTGQRLGPYELTRKLGQGGMGAVYVGVHRTLQMPRAIKVLLPSEVDEAVVERFVREGVISASLRHRNIVEIFDVGEEEGSHFLVMELIDGQSLLQLLRDTGALPLERAVGLLRQIADALDYAHAKGVVHRDIKPSNVIVEPDDSVTLIDFGIARAMDESRLTRVGVVVGTFEYMAPEVVTEGGGSPGADRYALGIVAYQMLTGRVPFTGESAHSIMYRQVHDPPPPPSRFRPDLPGPAEDALLRQLAKSPDERFPSAQAFVDALGASLRQHPRDAEPTSIADITRPGFDHPTPGTGQTPVPRSDRATRPVPRPVTRPATAATLTPPGARALPAVPPAPVTRRDQAGGTPRSEAAFSQVVTTPPPTTPATEAPRRPVGPTIGLITALVAIVLALAAAVVLVSPLREVVLAPFVAVTPTSVAVEQPTPRVTAAVTPATSTPQGVTPTAQAITPTARVATQTPQAATPTAQVMTPTPAAPPTLTPNQRIAEARDTAEAGNHSAALALLEELRGANPTLAGLDDARYDVHMAFARSLLDQGNLDGSYEQFGAALGVRPNDPTARAGQDDVVLTKNYRIMEEAWDRDDERAIKALEENMAINADFRETRPKLYALLIAKADRLLGAGERDAALPVLMRALEVLPNAGEAQRRLASYTPTPAPQPASQPPASKPQQQPASKPQQPAYQQPQPAYQQPASRPATGTGTGSSGSGSGAGSSCPGGVCP